MSVSVMCWKPCSNTSLCSRYSVLSSSLILTFLTTYTMSIIVDLLISSLQKPCKSSYRSGRSFLQEQTSVTGITRPFPIYAMYSIQYSFFHNTIFVIFTGYSSEIVSPVALFMDTITSLSMVCIIAVTLGGRKLYDDEAIMVSHYVVSWMRRGIV
jgi:hypothetical protein